MQCDIGKESARDLFYGHRQVGVVAHQLSDDSIPCNKGVLLRTPGPVDPVPNTACVWVGGEGVTASNAANGGMPIPPGETLFVPIDDPARLWVISTDADQDVAWMAM